MYPGTIFEFEDQSAIQKVTIDKTLVRPLFMCAFTSDKGPEAYTVTEGEEFFKLYGDDISFARHGQPLLQAAVAINAGGTIFAKRIVAEDSAIANTAIVAEVSTISVQKTDATGKLIYKNAGGTETTDAKDPDTQAANTAVMIDSANIKYTTRTVAAQADAATAAVAVKAKLATEVPTAGTTLYPLYCICDVGRGISNKKIRISPDYPTSKSSTYTNYRLDVSENGNTLESIEFAFNPEQTDGGANVSANSMINNNSKQIKLVQFDSDILDFYAKVNTITKVDLATLKEYDLLFGADKSGIKLSTVTIADGSIAMSAAAGIALTSGDNGTFGTAPIATEHETAYTSQMAKAFTGGYGNEIYDLDKYKIDVVVDANYPATVKRAIENFVTFREDCVYFRDLGLGNTTLDAVKTAATTAGLNNKFITTNCTTFDVIDPYSKKQIKVTAGYSLTKLIVPHFASGRNRPLAGILNGFIFSDAIKGTVNFIPVITPSVNEKTALEDLRINYASYYDNQLVVETCYTSQSSLSEFSFVNNILAIQEVTKAVRSQCPKIRYGFIDGDDLEKYKADVQKVLDRYTSGFMTMTLEYIEDAVMTSNRIFYAAIKVKFRKFVQTEYFKVIALGN